MKIGDKAQYGDIVGVITSMHGPPRYQVEVEFKIGEKKEIGYFNTLGTPQFKDLKDPTLKLKFLE